MKLQTITAALALSLSVSLSVSLSAHAAVSSTFDSNAEGWSGLTAKPYENGAPEFNAGPLGEYSVVGGHPGGYFRLPDPDSEDTFFRAPAAFLGNQSGAFGGTLSYDLTTNASINYAGPNVVLKGAGNTLVYFLPVQPAVRNSWVTVGVTLAPSAQWHLGSVSGGAVSASQFQATLGSLTQLWISAETHSPVEETSGLDNVFLAAAVPEPSAAGLMLLGLAAFGGLRWRRRAA